VALVVLLRGVNVGGHRTFRPAALAAQLAHLDTVNIGAAGTFVIRKRIGRGDVRTEFAQASIRNPDRDLRRSRDRQPAFTRLFLESAGTSRHRPLRPCAVWPRTVCASDACDVSIER
jgi:hypothetical protein